MFRENLKKTPQKSISDNCMRRELKAQVQWVVSKKTQYEN